MDPQENAHGLPPEGGWYPTTYIDSFAISLFFAGVIGGLLGALMLYSALDKVASAAVCSVAFMGQQYANWLCNSGSLIHLRARIRFVAAAGLVIAFVVLSAKAGAAALLFVAAAIVVSVVWTAEPVKDYDGIA